MSIGIGISTYNRPEAFNACVDAVVEHAPKGAYIVAADDGSDVDYGLSFLTADASGVCVLRNDHANVATNKNRLLRAMMDEGCEHLFLVEDDMVPQHPKAFAAYVRASERWGARHLLFAHHGSRNFQVDADHALTYHYECVGSFCYYHRSTIEAVGYMDEQFQNAWEHVVHSLLISQHDGGALMPNAGWRRWPDVAHSFDYITETPTPSTHKVRTEDELMAQERVQAGLRYWAETYPFPEDIRPLLKG